MNLANWMIVLLITAVPMLATNRPRTKRLSRGVQQLKESPQRIEEATREARARYAEYQRWGVVPFAAADGSRADGFGHAAEMVRDLQYIRNVLVVDEATMLAAAAQFLPSDAVPDNVNSLQLARHLELSRLIVGTVTPQGQNSRLTAKLLDTAGKSPRILATAQRTGHEGQFHELLDSLLLELLAAGDIEVPADARAEMIKKPTTSVSARKHCDQGLLALYRAAGLSGDDQQAEEFNEQALRHAESALAEDPAFILAYIVQASALSNLGQSNVDALRTGFAQLGASPVDLLTQLELEGDFEQDFNNDPDAASVKYSRMLEHSPGNLRALWSSLECLARDTGPPGFHEEDRIQASRWAGRIVAAHPRSTLAQFLSPDE